MDPDPKERTWPRSGGVLALTKCRAGAFAGAVTGLVAGLGVAIALASELNDDWLRVVLGAVVVFLASVGGLLTGAIASGCFRASNK